MKQIKNVPEAAGHVEFYVAQPNEAKAMVRLENALAILRKELLALMSRHDEIMKRMGTSSARFKTGQVIQTTRYKRSSRLFICRVEADEAPTVLEIPVFYVKYTGYLITLEGTKDARGSMVSWNQSEDLHLWPGSVEPRSLVLIASMWLAFTSPLDEEKATREPVIYCASCGVTEPPHAIGCPNDVYDNPLHPFPTEEKP